MTEAKKRLIDIVAGAVLASNALRRLGASLCEVFTDEVFTNVFTKVFTKIPEYIWYTWRVLACPRRGTPAKAARVAFHVSAELS